MKTNFNKKDTEGINDFLLENNVIESINNLLLSKSLDFEVGSLKFVKLKKVKGDQECPDGYVRKSYCTKYGKCTHVCVKV